MKFKTPNCLACGEPASGIEERLAGTAALSLQPDGEFEYAGETKIDWDSQESEEDELGRVTLYCDNNHTWHSEYITDDGRSSAIEIAPGHFVTDEHGNVTGYVCAVRDGLAQVKSKGASSWEPAETLRLMTGSEVREALRRSLGVEEP